MNKVAESGIITLNLEQFVPNNMMVFDLKPFLFMEMILKEKDYRATLLAHDWSVYENKNVVITCSVDAITPAVTKFNHALEIIFSQHLRQRCLNRSKR